MYCSNYMKLVVTSLLFTVTFAAAGFPIIVIDYVEDEPVTEAQNQPYLEFQIPEHNVLDEITNEDIINHHNSQGVDDQMLYHQTFNSSPEDFNESDYSALEKNADYMDVENEMNGTESISGNESDWNDFIEAEKSLVEKIEKNKPQIPWVKPKKQHSLYMDWKKTKFRRYECEPKSNGVYKEILVSNDTVMDFVSPNHMNLHTSNLDCGWRMKTNNMHKFHIFCYGSNVAERDYLRFTELDVKHRQPLHARRFETDADIDFKSKTNFLEVNFTSNANGTGRGFWCRAKIILDEERYKWVSQRYWWPRETGPQASKHDKYGSKLPVVEYPTDVTVRIDASNSNRMTTAFYVGNQNLSSSSMDPTKRTSILKNLKTWVASSISVLSTSLFESVETNHAFGLSSNPVGNEIAKTAVIVTVTKTSESDMTSSVFGDANERKNYGEVYVIQNKIENPGKTTKSSETTQTIIKRNTDSAVRVDKSMIYSNELNTGINNNKDFESKNTTESFVVIKSSRKDVTNEDPYGTPNFD